MASDRDNFEIAIICALPLEATAVSTIFEKGSEDTGNGESSSGTGKAAGDINTYTVGKVGSHNVVLVHMPGMGKIPAAAVAVSLKQSFKNIKLALVVGICGGVPGEGAEGIMLGDVVVGKQVVHYDFGRQFENVFIRKDSPEDGLGRQGSEIRGFIRKLEAGREALDKRTNEFLAPMLQPWSAEKINNLQDILYPADYWHIHQKTKANCIGQRCQNGVEVCESALTSSCEELGCDQDELVRPADPRPRPKIHFGSVASGDKVVKSATFRDNVARRDGVIAFDMEAAGVWEYLPCILIKGVCDYADSHKNKSWQEYAAITAAAFTKAVVERWSQSDQPTDRQPAKYQVKNQFNNYNSKIGNQADRVVFNGNPTLSF
ncbi:hypothetical protein TWF281_005749 [Arthrobotrys megalospora]